MKMIITETLTAEQIRLGYLPQMFRLRCKNKANADKKADKLAAKEFKGKAYTREDKD